MLMTDSTETDTDTDRSAQTGWRARRFEQVVVGISVVLTVALLGYATWQVFTVPAGTTPQVSIENTQTQPDGSVRATVALSNPRDRGLEQATVKTVCQNTSITVKFTDIPAKSTQTASVVCPQGTTHPRVSLSSWIE
jgi:hypothetical protein